MLKKYPHKGKNIHVLLALATVFLLCGFLWHWYTQTYTKAHLTLRTVLLSDVGVRPAHRANLHGSPSMCSVTPNSDVCQNTFEFTLPLTAYQYSGKKALKTSFCRWCLHFLTTCHPGAPYQQLVLVNIFGASWRVFHLFTENERDLKEEKMSVPALADQWFGVPHLEGVL